MMMTTVVAMAVKCCAYGLSRLDKFSRSVSDILLFDSDLESAVAEAVA